MQAGSPFAAQTHTHAHATIDKKQSALLGDVHTLATAQAAGAAGGNQTDLLAGGRATGHGGGVANVLMVATGERMLDGVHGHTAHLGPAVALGFVFVVGVAGLG